MGDRDGKDAEDEDPNAGGEKKWRRGENETGIEGEGGCPLIE